MNSTVLTLTRFNVDNVKHIPIESFAPTDLAKLFVQNIGIEQKMFDGSPHLQKLLLLCSGLPRIVECMSDVIIKMCGTNESFRKSSLGS